MSSTFTPSNTVDMSKEKDWAASLGMMDWDKTNIVFTKRSLVEFLKYTGTTVDVNFNNIAKLPRYATFGKLSEASTATTATEPVETAEAAATPSGDIFIPSRRVRTVPGGPHTDIFDHGDEGDALSQAPPRAPDARPIAVVPASAPAQVPDNQHVGLDFTSEVKPSRRVRENPGGTSSLANFWDSEETPEFKPTRRVREGPGGRDNISEFF